MTQQLIFEEFVWWKWPEMCRKILLGGSIAHTYWSSGESNLDTLKWAFVE